jgi:hypothetical protein
VKESTGENTFTTDRFTLSRGGRKVIDVSEKLGQAAFSRATTRPDFPPSGSRAANNDHTLPVTPSQSLDRSAAIWALSAGGTLTLRVGHDAPPIECRPGQSLPAADFDLTNVRLLHCPVTDVGLEHVRGLTHLAELALNGAPVTNAGVQCLQGLPELKNLALSNTSVTDDGLQYFTICRNSNGFGWTARV